MKELFFENYVPMNEDEKKKVGEDFKNVLREIGITNIKDISEQQVVKTKHPVWRIK